MLATRRARCIRFQINEDTLRVFAGRDSSGVRGIRLGTADVVISLSVLRHVDVTTEERIAYLKSAAAKRRSGDEEEPTTEPEEVVAEVALSPERIDALEAAEQYLLAVTDGGFGKRSSAYDYRVTGRGGSGIANITLGPRTGTAVMATLPVRDGDDVMLVTDAGRLIRLPISQVRITGRQAMGVTLFRLENGERVTSVFPVLEEVEPLADEPPVNESPVDRTIGDDVSIEEAPDEADE